MTSQYQSKHLLGKEEKPNKSEYTLRKMYEFYQGPVYKMFSRLELYKTQLSPEQIMRYKIIMDSMTNKELDGPTPEHMSVARMNEIARESRQDVKQIGEMLKECKRLEKVWRKVEKYMRNTKQMDKTALFWSEIVTPFYVEIIPEPEKIPPRKLELMNWVKWALILFFLYLIFW